jgi:Trypsin.
MHLFTLFFTSLVNLFILYFCLRLVRWSDIHSIQGNHRVTVLKFSHCNERKYLDSRNTVTVYMADETYEEVTAIASGWGTVKEDGKPSCILQKVEVPVMSNQECRKNTKYNEKMISDNMLCAGYPEGMKDSCQVSW